VDGRIIGPGRPGPITQQIQEVYFAVVKGQEARYQKWLTYI
jgi:branched-chain amino acid aminotransferase